MAKVEWSAGIDSVSGALSKPGKNGQHSCAKMLLGTHRVAATENPNCNRIYMRKKVERSTSPGANELFARVRWRSSRRRIRPEVRKPSKPGTGWSRVLLTIRSTREANQSVQKRSGVDICLRHFLYIFSPSNTPQHLHMRRFPCRNITI